MKMKPVPERDTLGRRRCTEYCPGHTKPFDTECVSTGPGQLCPVWYEKWHRRFEKAEPVRRWFDEQGEARIVPVSKPYPLRSGVEALLLVPIDKDEDDAPAAR
jgi:hypothetical protein